jgi:hypothetical protein
MDKRFLKALTLKRVRDAVKNSHIIRRFAKKHDIVYFGVVHPDDEARLVKGHTLSRTQHDQHYCVGSVFGRDVMFVQRTDVLRASKLKKREVYTWNILVLDMTNRTNLPHTFIEGRNRHGTAFYEAFSMKHRGLVEIPSHLLYGYDPIITKKFHIRTTVAQAVELPVHLTPQRGAVMAHHFSVFDYEWEEDTLYVYYLSRQPSMEKLDLMLKAGIWLADELEIKPPVVLEDPLTPVESSIGY